MTSAFISSLSLAAIMLIFTGDPLLFISSVEAEDLLRFGLSGSQAVEIRAGMRSLC